MTSEKRNLLVKSKGEDPLNVAAPRFSNFLAVSRMGTDVQFEFVYNDINRLAQLLEEARAGNEMPEIIEGKTVVKVVMPAWAVIQLKTHMKTIFDGIEQEITSAASTATEESEEERHARSGT
jgi:hypothetical protein